jgi:hypothetical protein
MIRLPRADQEKARGDPGPIWGWPLNRCGCFCEWDLVNMKVTNIPEADAFVTKKYRAGWSV